MMPLKHVVKILTAFSVGAILLFGAIAERLYLNVEFHRLFFNSSINAEIKSAERRFFVSFVFVGPVI